MLRSFLAGTLVLAVLFGAQAQTGTKNYKHSVRQTSRKKGKYYRAGTLKATGAGKRKMEVSRGDYYLAPGMPMPQTDHRHIDSYMGDVPPRKHYPKKGTVLTGNSTLIPARK